MGNDLYNRPWQQQGSGEIGNPKIWRELQRKLERGRCLSEKQQQNIVYQKSMVHDHSSLKVKQVSSPGPSPVLMIEEETESCYLLLSLSLSFLTIISTCAAILPSF